jgi:hypothetical protein
MTPLIPLELSILQSQFLSLSDKYEEYRNDAKKRGVNDKAVTPSSSQAIKTREPFRELLADPSQLLEAMFSPTPKVTAAPVFKEDDYDDEKFHVESQRSFPQPVVEFDVPEKEKFDLMNVKIVVYGLNGLICEKEPATRRLFGRRNSGISVDASVKGSSFMGFSGSSISSGDIFSTTEVDCMDQYSTPTTAVVSCHKNGISSQMSLETFLPSLPIQRPIATFVNKVRYAASWPSEQFSLHQDESAIDRSTFEIIRCMQQAMFVPGVAAGSNYLPETVELRVNLSRGTELIRLGTASLVINGDEEVEVSMNIPAKPTQINSRKMKRKKNKRNKYGYFSGDPTRRYFLDDNATLRIGVQVIPEVTVRFVQEKEKVKREQELKQILDQDDLKELLRQMADDNLNRPQRVSLKGFSADLLASKERAKDAYNKQIQLLMTPQDKCEQGNHRSIFSGMFCGAMTIPTIPTSFCVAGPFASSEEEPEIPMEIHTDQEMDKFSIASIISSVSESTDGSFLGEYYCPSLSW